MTEFELFFFFFFLAPPPQMDVPRPGIESYATTAAMPQQELQLELFRYFLITTLKVRAHDISRRKLLGVFRWLSSLRTLHCHCCGTGSIPGPWTSACYQCSQKKKKKKKTLQCASSVVRFNPTNLYSFLTEAIWMWFPVWAWETEVNET